MIEQSLKDILEKSFNCSELVVTNQSHLHHGHSSSPQNGQSHFHVLIVSDDFKNLSRIQCHQRVNMVVGKLFSDGLHALSLDIRAK